MASLQVPAKPQDAQPRSSPSENGSGSARASRHHRTNSQQRSKSHDRHDLAVIAAAVAAQSSSPPPSPLPDDGDVSPSPSASPTASSPTPTKSKDPAARQKALMRQIEYYFSNQNLWKDAFLLHEMSQNEGHYVALAIIQELKKVKKLTDSVSEVMAAIKCSNKLELSSDESSVKRVQPLPPYDQLKDAHRSLYVNNLPQGSTLKSVKKLFSMFGKVTYVLRAEQIESAANLNSPRSSPRVLATASPPMSPLLMPRLSLSTPSHQTITLPSTPTPIVAPSSPIPSVSASDSIDAPFTSAYVQFEKPASMQKAVEMIQAKGAATNSSAAVKPTEKIISIGNSNSNSPSSGIKAGTHSPLLGRRSLGSGSSPIPSSRALSSQSFVQLANSTDAVVSSLNLMRTTLPITASPGSIKRRLGSSSPPNESAAVINMIDMSPSSPAQPVALTAPGSPAIQPLDSSVTPAQLPSVFATLTVMPKVDRLREQVEEEERKAKLQEKEQQKNERIKKQNSSWRNANYTPSDTKPPTIIDDHNSTTEDLSEDEERRRALQRRRDEDLRQRERERAGKKALEDRKAAHSDDNIIHISPRPSPGLSPSVTPITPIMPLALSQMPHIHPHSPQLSPALMGLSVNASGIPALSLQLACHPPLLDLNKPRFSLTKRTSVVASNVASRFALGPDNSESKGFNGRGRGKILMNPTVTITSGTPIFTSTLDIPHIGFDKLTLAKH